MGSRYVVSADSHIMEPYDLWTKVLADKYGDRLPHVVKECKGIRGTFFFTGYEYMPLDDYIETMQETATHDIMQNPPQPGEAPEAPPELLSDDVVEKINRSNSDPRLRVELMDRDGLAAEVINPTFGLLMMRTPDAGLVLDCCRVYNDWMAHYCSENPRRLLGSAMIPLDDVTAAVKELERAAKKKLCNALIYTDAKPGMLPYRDKHYDRFWAAAQDVGMPIGFHIIPGLNRDPYTLVTPEEKELIARLWLGLPWEVGPVLANEFIFGGIFDRFPKLQVMLEEYEISWLPNYLWKLRQLEGAAGRTLGLRRVKKSVDEYMATQVWHGVVFDRYFELGYQVTVPSQILWGSDFPHPRSSFPNTYKILDRMLGKLSPQEKAGVEGLNVARLLGLEVPQGSAAAE